MKINILTILMFAGILSFLNISCKKAEGPDKKYYIPSPDNLTISTEGATVTADWEYPADKRVASFVVQLSYDKNFATIAQTDTVNATERSASFENANLVTEYFVRARALAGDIVISSNFSTASLKLESIFNPIPRSDIKATSVVLKWNAPATGTVTHVVLLPEGKPELAPVQLSSSDISSHSVSISGLTGATQYTALIYNGEERKGVVTFTTRDVNERITINSGVTVYETIQDAVNAAATGDVIYFGGAKYDFSGVTVTVENKSLTFQAIPNSQMIPEITFKNFDLKGSISSFKISGLKIISTSKAITTGNTDYNKHIFGLTYVTGNVNLVVENSDLSGAESGLCFTQTVGASSAPATVPGSGVFNLSIDNCLLHDFGNAGGDFMDFRSGSVGNISLRNTTFWNGARAFLRTDATASVAGGSKIVFDSNTFYNFCNGGIFLRIGTAGANIEVNKCIIHNKVTNNGNSISSSTFKLNNNNIAGTNSANITAGVSSGGNVGTTALDPQFVNAAGGDFTVGNSVLRTAGIGDPRWLK